MERDGAHVPFVSSGSYPIRSGNAVEPLVDGEPAFRRICQAVENARHSVWLTVAFYEQAFEMPDGRGSLFDVLDAARGRGVDVRVIFWRHRIYEQMEPGVHFSGTKAELDALRARGSHWHARWDQAEGAYCQHQKSWLIDAGTPNEVVFVGGINLNASSVVPPGHPPTDAGNTHDVYVQLRGPAATDVHHNFVQRWNEASDRDEPDGAWPMVDTPAQHNALPFPTAASADSGDAVVQVQRTVRRGRYRNGHPTPGGEPFAIEAGEHSVVDQYLHALAAARSTIYLECQAIGSPQIVDALDAALVRGVDVVFVVPATPNEGMGRARDNAKSKPFFESLAALGRHDGFALVGISTRRATGQYQDIYVHSKLTLIDDQWCTIGSANVLNRSFYGDTELNASIWHADTVRTLRCALVHEHTGEDTAHLGDRAALALFRQLARDNAPARAAGEPMRGLAFALDPATYGT
ncbi:MAG: phosphatidylserine/phosphatidylglycerophosphate/cardiolipin synthase family protein [Myxococcales bacterium]|nr:phosphatidylserine/phosphatidylglycerophosphate/cardiolipin synthase family protein [Myxococcales bacterium]